MFAQLALRDLSTVKGFEQAEEIRRQLHVGYPSSSPAQDIVIDLLAMDLFRLARATSTEILATELDDKLLNQWSQRCTQYGLAMNKLRQSVLAVLAKLDERAHDEIENDIEAEEGSNGAELSAAPTASAVAGEVPSSADVDPPSIQ